jgi:exonuclease III
VCELNNLKYNQWIKVMPDVTKKEMLCIGNYYVPVRKKGNATKRDTCISSLKKNVRMIKKKLGSNVKILICGDMNMIIGRTSSDDGIVMGNCGELVEPCDDGKKIREFINNKRLFLRI